MAENWPIAMRGSKKCVENKPRSAALPLLRSTPAQCLEVALAACLFGARAPAEVVPSDSFSVTGCWRARPLTMFRMTFNFHRAAYKRVRSPPAEIWQPLLRSLVAMLEHQGTSRSTVPSATPSIQITVLQEYLDCNEPCGTSESCFDFV